MHIRVVIQLLIKGFLDVLIDELLTISPHRLSYYKHWLHNVIIFFPLFPISSFKFKHSFAMELFSRTYRKAAYFCFKKIKLHIIALIEKENYNNHTPVIIIHNGSLGTKIGGE